MAVLHGERKLFANLYVTISRWIAEWSEWLSAKKESSKPKEGDPSVGSMKIC